MEKQLLEVGDIIYSARGYDPPNPYSIERVTEKQAVYGNGLYKCQRAVNGGKARKIGSSDSVYLETPKLKADYEIRQLRHRIFGLLDRVSNLNYQYMELNELVRIKDLLNVVLNPERSVATSD